ncbi:hypothetical protein NDK43_25860 [Neobacillus pocheonensis]|uniref:Uncharacterized protein n=1 Tax=Neobacillus pocheonensis TaxID=363869 RepID=A0ABT0WFQ4_9BACI|nr:hypothetical protein [Neobacillus pocheonensis]
MNVTITGYQLTKFIGDTKEDFYKLFLVVEGKLKRKYFYTELYFDSEVVQITYESAHLEQEFEKEFGDMEELIDLVLQTAISFQELPEEIRTVILEHIQKRAL